MPYLRPLQLVLSLAIVLLGGCSASGVEPIASPPINVEGVYQSTEAVGPLGRLTLALRLRGESVRVYRATLNSTDTPTLAESTGIGTLGNDHLILNFDVRTEGDYFFQGTVANSGSAIDSIAGTFLFPGQTEELPVTFEYTGVLPPEEEEQ